MSLIVEISVNENLIARAVARNQSNLADTSDYIVTAIDYASPFNGNKDRHYEGVIEGHNRNQPSFELVRKMMELLNDQYLRR